MRARCESVDDRADTDRLRLPGAGGEGDALIWCVGEVGRGTVGRGEGEPVGACSRNNCLACLGVGLALWPEGCALWAAIRCARKRTRHLAARHIIAKQPLHCAIRTARPKAPTACRPEPARPRLRVACMRRRRCSAVAVVSRRRARTRGRPGSCTEAL